MQSVIDEEGKKNLINKLSNLNTTGSEEISLTDALKALDSTLLERVGTKTSTTRPLNRINNMLSDLEQQKAEIEKKNNSFMETVLDLREQNSILNGLNKNLNNYTKKGLYDILQVIITEKGTGRSDHRKRQNRGKHKESNRNIIKLKNYENISAETVSEITMMLREQQQIEEVLRLEQTRLTEFQEKCDELSELLEPEELFEKR